MSDPGAKEHLNESDANNSMDKPAAPNQSPCRDDDNDDNAVGKAEEGCGSCHLPPWRVVITVVACTVIQGTLGLSYIRGNMMPYTTSYLRNVTGETSLDYTRMLWLGNSGWISFSASVPFLGLLQKRMSHHKRLYIFMGICLHIGSHLGSYWGVQNSFAMMVAFNGVMAGIAQAMVYPPCLGVAIQWFPQHRGLVGGLNMAGFGVGAFIWNQVITIWINPDNMQPDQKEGENLYFTQTKVLDKVPSCYLLMGGILTFLQLASLVSITFPPAVVSTKRCPEDAKNRTDDVTQEGSIRLQHANLDPQGAKWDDVNPEEKPESHDAPEKFKGQRETKRSQVGVEEGKGETCGAETCLQQAPFETATKDEGTQSELLETSGRTEYGPLQILRCPVTWLMYINALTVDLAFIFIVSFYKTYGQTYVHDDHFLSLVGSFASVFNAAGRPVWGLIADKIGFLPALLLTETVLVVSSATFVACELVGSSAMFFIWVCVMYESMGSVFGLQGPIVSTMFGFKYFVFSYGLITSTGLVTCFVSVALTDYLLPLYGWRSVYYAAALSVAFGVIVMVPLLITCGRRSCVSRHLQERLLATSGRKRAK